MRRDAVTGVFPAGCLLAVAALLLGGCTGGPAPVAPSPTAAPTPTAVPALAFEDAVAALTRDLVPAADVQPCEVPAPGSPDEGALAGPTGEPSVTGDEAMTTSPSAACGTKIAEALRAASLTGFAHGPGDEVVLPVAGGAARVVEVYELADAGAAAAVYAARVAEEEGWATDQEIPAEDLEGGTYTPRRVISGAGVTGLDLPGWTATVVSRDEAAFTRTGEPASDPVSYAYVWAVRDALLVQVQVAGDVPGGAATTATTTALAFTAAAEGPAAGG
ncbi:hypothetical protein H9657_03720 [Cellulomonas sp. Sa3CUA2]|uniref:DUF5642 domain-containing protein n=1 Tax=Cellulomonas avistercoris TaxID=2762242 RepID=A0ABR8QAE5_9CELL|nr:hypothetical protein [Cellulomonas avistercoris]MBD7917387.1 hypothetical protein [Cellulomonas avistercoris]